MKKDIVLFDIDYTLFNTEIFSNKLHNVIAKVLAVDSKKLIEMQEEALNILRSDVGYFHPYKYAKLLSEKIGKKEKEAEIVKAILNPQIFLDNYYEETIEVLSNLGKYVTIGIFSKGQTEFQKAKLKKIVNLLSSSHIHITVDKHVALPKVLEMYKEENLYFVDDALDVLCDAKKMSSKTNVIWVKRGKYAQKQLDIEGFTPDAIIRDLRELLPIILKDK